MSEGRTLGDLREFFARKIHSERVQADDFRRTAFEMGGAALIGAGPPPVDVVVEGRARLFEQRDFVSPEGMRQIMSVLEDVDLLVRLLDATADARKTAVFLGRETNVLGGGEVAMIGASYRRQGHTQGAIGIIGPTRMDYSKVVPLVTATASAMSELYERDRRSAAHLPEHDDD